MCLTALLNWQNHDDTHSIHIIIYYMTTMSSIKNLEMDDAFSANQHIEIKKSLFSTKTVYTHTQSLAKAIIL